MSYNGTGTFSVNTAGQPVVTGTTITSTAFNTLTADLATGLSTALCKDGQSTPTANIGLGAFKITNLGAGTLATDAARLSQIQSGAATFVVASGTDTILGTGSPALTAYATGNAFSFTVASTNTGAVTLNIDSLGAKAVTRDGSTALVAGDLVSGSVVTVVYDGTRFQVLNSNSKTNWHLSGTLTNNSLTSGRIPYSTTAGLQTDSANLLYSGADLTVYGLSVGRGGGAIATNTAVGYQALVGNTTGNKNVALGYQAGYTNTTGVANVFLGRTAGYPNTTGSNNTAVGDSALSSNTTAAENTAVGAEAMLFSDTAAGNTAIGRRAGYALVSGNGSNVFIGGYAGYACTGSFNTLVGYAAGIALTTGVGNTIIGPQGSSYNPGGAMTTGSKNTLIGNFSGNNNGLDIRTSSNNIVLSDGDGVPRMRIDSSGFVGIGTVSPSPYKLKVADGRVYFQNDSSGDPNLYISNASYAGTFIYFYSYSGFTGAITYSGNVTSYTSASDYRMKNVIGVVSDSGARIDALKPIDFEWKSNNLKARGFLAHEFQEVYPSSVTGTKDGTKEEEYEVTPAVEATKDEDGVELTPAEPAVKGTRTVPDYQAMQASTSEVIADLVAELQSLRKRIATLESK